MAREGMIFKELEESLLELKKRLKSIDESENKKRIPIIRKLKALQEVADYVDSCDWYYQEKPKEKIKKIRAAKYNYELIAEELDVTVNSIHSFMRYAIKKVKEKIGENTVSLIMDGEISIALVQFYALSGKFSLNKILKSEVVENLPNSKFDPYTLIDCKKEISFLYDYSEEIFKKRLESLDKRKMAFIRYIAEKNTPKFSEDKYYLLKLLTGNGGSKADYFKKLDENTTYRP